VPGQLLGRVSPPQPDPSGLREALAFNITTDYVTPERQPEAEPATADEAFARGRLPYGGRHGLSVLGDGQIIDGPTERELQDWHEHNAHIDCFDLEAERLE
jgi:hypothetical protein